MNVFSFKRLLGAAALYGIVRYVKANGGPQAAFETLRGKVTGLFAQAKTSVDQNFATNTGHGPLTSESDAATPPTYASYKLDDDRNLH